MLTDEQKMEIIQRVKAELKKRADEKADETEEKDQKITDPLKNAKAIIKHYGTHNRLK